MYEAHAQMAQSVKPGSSVVTLPAAVARMEHLIARLEDLTGHLYSVSNAIGAPIVEDAKKKDNAALESGSLNELHYGITRAEDFLMSAHEQVRILSEVLA